MSFAASELERPARTGGWKLAVLAGLMVTILALGLVLGQEWGHFASSALEALPFAVLAILAYLGTERRWARWLALATLTVIVFVVALSSVAMTAVAAMRVGAAPDQKWTVSEDGYRNVALVGIGVVVAISFAATGFIPAVRWLLARFLPLDPSSFVHMVALVLVVALTLITLIPLLVLTSPPMLSPSLLSLIESETAARGRAGMLRDEVYGLMWLIPVAVIAVGFGIRRTLKESLERLGFVTPTWGQVALGLGVALGLFLAVRLAGPGIEWLWGVLGWPTTDTKGLERIFAHFSSPLGAVIIGVVAGIGEELAVRGALQPRLGIWLSNLFFTSLHAFQYNWDVLLIVFLIGMALGVLRQKTNTTTCALVHGTYNFVLTIVLLYQIPWLST